MDMRKFKIVSIGWDVEIAGEVDEEMTHIWNNDDSGPDGRIPLDSMKELIKRGRAAGATGIYFLYEDEFVSFEEMLTEYE